MKTKYTIHDVAALLGISTDAIRLYEKEGLVSPLRDPKNGYRYYEYDQIHRIMGISLYRQLDVGIAEIRELLNDQTFPEVCTHFEEYIAQSEQEIIRLKNRMEKLKFMKRTLNQEKKIEKVLSELTKIQKDYSDKKIANILESIKKELNCLI